MTAAELRAALGALGLTQRAAALKVGITPRHMRYVLAGRRAIKPELAAKVSALLMAANPMRPAALEAAIRGFRLQRHEAARVLGLTIGQLRAMLRGDLMVPPDIRAVVRSWF